MQAGRDRVDRAGDGRPRVDRAPAAGGDAQAGAEDQPAEHQLQVDGEAVAHHRADLARAVARAQLDVTDLRRGAFAAAGVAELAGGDVAEVARRVLERLAPAHLVEPGVEDDVADARARSAWSGPAPPAGVRENDARGEYGRLRPVASAGTLSGPIAHGIVRRTDQSVPTAPALRAGRRAPRRRHPVRRAGAGGAAPVRARARADAGGVARVRARGDRRAAAAGRRRDASGSGDVRRRAPAGVRTAARRLALGGAGGAGAARARRRPPGRRARRSATPRPRT